MPMKKNKRRIRAMAQYLETKNKRRAKDNRAISDIYYRKKKGR